MVINDIKPIQINSKLAEYKIYLIGLNKLKEDALNQVNKEIQRTTRYRSRDFRSGKKGELIDKETVQESVDDVTKVSSGPSLGIVKQNLINDRKRIAQNIAKLDGVRYAASVSPILSSLALSLASLNSINN